MPESGSLRPFEVYCNRCNVTFPAESRHCIHCGGRLSRSSTTTGSSLSPRRLAVAEGEDLVPVEEEETTRRSPFSPLALIWIVLLVVGSIYRACTGT